MLGSSWQDFIQPHLLKPMNLPTGAIMASVALLLSKSCRRASHGQNLIQNPAGSDWEMLLLGIQEKTQEQRNGVEFPSDHLAPVSETQHSHLLRIISFIFQGYTKLALALFLILCQSRKLMHVVCSLLFFHSVWACQKNARPSYKHTAYKYSQVLIAMFNQHPETTDSQP